MYRFFLFYGLVVLGLFTYADFRGWAPSNYDEIKNVPKSIRDNPGAYRTIYHRYYHK